MSWDTSWDVPGHDLGRPGTRPRHVLLHVKHKAVLLYKMPKQAFIMVPDAFEMPNLEFVNHEIWPLVICQTIEILKL